MDGNRTSLLIAFLLCSATGASGSEDIEFFEKRIRPILVRHCFQCHSAAAPEIKGGLRLDSRDLIRRGGETGPAVVPGDVEKSLLVDAIRHETMEMPPDEMLPESVVADFVAWIKNGAIDPRDQPPTAKELSELSWQAILQQRRGWWSLQPPTHADPPIAGGSPIDAFIQHRLHQEKVGASPEAPPRILARRLSLVLTGLPPAPADVDRFVKAYRLHPEEAYEALADQLLDSPPFGEHWARHWMDVVRFAETHGYEWNHEIRGAWRYRDYLIRAFNADLPYDQLVREHIAGDLLETPRLNDDLGINESIIATAFWRFGELGHDDCVEFPEIRFDALDNQIDTFSKAFQGLTISCARCHDHKIDAISTKDYYGLAAILESCSQVVHTIDSKGRIDDLAASIEQLKTQIRSSLGALWLGSMTDLDTRIASVISDGTQRPGATALARHITGDKLDHSDPGFVLGRLARREGGAENQLLIDTRDIREAHWLWYPEGNAAVNAPIESRYFRRQLKIPKGETITRAFCLFAGDDSVTFYLNGSLIGTGNSHPNLAAADLATKLRTGTNELAVVNTNGNPAIQPNPGGWIGTLRVEFENHAPIVIYSDAEWMCSRVGKPGWQTAGFEAPNWVAARETGKAGIPPWGLPWPKQLAVRGKAEIEAVWESLRREYAQEHARRIKSNAENFEPHVDFRSGQSSDWNASGLGLEQGPTSPGEFTINHDGDDVISAVLPAGWYTNATSDRLNGSLRSPWLPKSKKFISVQLVGANRSMIRPVVDTCGLNEFAGGGLQYLANGKTTWKRLPTSAGAAHRSFIELTTKSDNPRWPDRPGRAGTKDPKELQSPRSSFGVMRAVLHDAPIAPLPELNHMMTLLGEDEKADARHIAHRFQAAAHDAVTAWTEDQASDAHVLWINWLLRTKLLPNSFQDDEHLGSLVRQYRELESSIPPPRVVAGLADQGGPRGFPVLKGGDPLQPLAVVAPRYIEVLSQSSSFHARGSGRRQLAEIIASPANPLTARVMVNRIWHHLFGRGIVATPDDFGAMGQAPTHPELLDNLAIQFANDRWSIKRLIRRIVLSQTFRRSSLPSERSAEVDPGNQWLHHYPSRRLSAESIRDTLLTISGRIDLQPFGQSIHPHRKKEIDYRKLWSGPLDGDGRRSLYIKVTRMEGPKFLELFDFPNPMATRGRRDRTNVPAQALALLNDPFVIDQADYWAKQLLLAGDATIEQRVQRMFRKALGRQATDTEEKRFVELVYQLADTSSTDDTILELHDVWQDAAHAIFNMKEVIYIR